MSSTQSLDKVRAALEELGISGPDLTQILELTRQKLAKFGLTATNRPQSLGHIVKQKQTADTDNRRELIGLMVSQEKGYISNLASMIHTYMQPMKKKKLLKSDQFPIVFSNVEALLPIHTQLLTRLEECYAAWPNSHLGSAFLKAIPAMRKYSAYVNNFGEAMDFFMRQMENSKFAAFVENQSDICEHAPGMRLDVLLSCPLNRIPQYELLLEQIINLTPEGDPEESVLVETIRRLAELQLYLAENLQRSDRAKVIRATLAEKITGYNGPAVDNGKISLIKEGVLHVGEGHGKKVSWKEFHCILLSDRVLLSRSKTFSDSFQFYKAIEFPKAQLEVPPPRKDAKYQLQVNGPQPPFLVSCPTAESNAEWVAAFQEVEAFFGATKIFGTSLKEIMSRKEETKDIPLFMERCLQNLSQEKALETQGLFRISGSASLIQSTRDALDRGHLVEFPNLDTHTVAGLFKLWLRELSDPLLTFELYNEFTTSLESENPMLKIKETIAKLPAINKAVLYRLLKFLLRVSKHAEVNKMNPNNLAIVFGPNLLRTPNVAGEMDSFLNPSIFKNVYAVVTVMIFHFDTIFDTAPAAPSPRVSRSGTGSKVLSRQSTSSSALGIAPPPPAEALAATLPPPIASPLVTPESPPQAAVSRLEDLPASATDSQQQSPAPSPVVAASPPPSPLTSMPPPQSLPSPNLPPPVLSPRSLPSPAVLAPAAADLDSSPAVSLPPPAVVAPSASASASASAGAEHSPPQQAARALPMRGAPRGGLAGAGAGAAGRGGPGVAAGRGGPGPGVPPGRGGPGPARGGPGPRGRGVGMRGGVGGGRGGGPAGDGGRGAGMPMRGRGGRGGAPGGGPGPGVVGRGAPPPIVRRS
eukprot:CAMPEP_0177638968 /NCGR_PEP_ID=MMETSP0447-20121125/5771_1 /TAXON_ID=0 /ORGANISM="Stygamoeba regulata, Strain BSH-02190019" /LENGTH=867 /DNA_ID=CAMNT_0019140965 /DNA_START=273 /DNA_END=2876 /DNA_ORIENTATION=+